MAMSLTLMGNQPSNQVSQRWLRMTATMATIWTTVLSLPRSLAWMVKPSLEAMERRPLTRNSRPMTRTAIQGFMTWGL